MKEKVSSFLAGWMSQYKNSFFLKKLSSLLAVDILAKMLTVVLLPVYLWVMKQEEYGVYNYILSIVTTFSMILNFGLYVSQSKYYSDSSNAAAKGTVTFNIFILLSSFLALAIITVYSTGLDYKLVNLLFKNEIDYTSYRWPILLAVVSSVYALIVTNFLITSEKIRLFRRYNIYKLILVNVVVLTMLFLYDTDKIFVRLLYTYIIELLVLLVFGFVYLKEMHCKIDGGIMRASLKLGLPIMFSAIWSLFSNYSDKFFLEKYGSARDLSYYYLAFSISNILLMICTAIQNAWLPSFLKEKDISKTIRNTRKIIGQVFILLSGLSLLFILGLYICLKINIISEQYWPTVYVLPILLLAQIVNGVLLLYSNYLIYLEKTHWGLTVGIATSVIGLVASYLLIPIWNVYGAALVYLIVQLTYLAIYYFLVQYKLKNITLQSTNNPNNGEDIH